MTESLTHAGSIAEWQMVPTEITEEMHAAAVRTAARCSGNDDFPPRVYRAMLAAAPTPPAVMPAAPSEVTDEQIIVLRRKTMLGAHQPRASDLAFARAVLALSQTMQPQAEPVAGEQSGAVADAQLQALWDEACKDSPGNPGWSRHLRFGRSVARLTAPGAAREQEATFEQWWSRQQGAAKGRLPGDDFLMLDEDDKGQYEAAFNAGRRLASRDEAPATPQGEIPAAPSAPNEVQLLPWQAITEDDLSEYERFLVGEGVKNAGFFPVDANRLANIALHCIREVRATRATLTQPTTVQPFQARVQPWLMACFGEMIAGDREERNHRFIEEALELVQACGCTASEAHQLVDYVFARPVGEKAQEVGGVMVTLAALCLAQNLDMAAAGETELARIWTKVEQIRAKQLAKPKHSPLPAHAHDGAPLETGEGDAR